MRAVLIYQGKVSTSQHRKNVHEIRREFHPQLKELWRIEEPLKTISERIEVLWDNEHIGCIYQLPDNGSWIGQPKGRIAIGPWPNKEMAIQSVVDNRLSRTNVGLTSQHTFSQHVILVAGEDYIANQYSAGGFRCVPIVTPNLSLMCYLKIVVLRPDPPGSIVSNCGDIDNHLKVVFDALRRPISDEELRGASPQDGEDPFYCLLEDDKLISGFEVTTEQWLRPLGTKGEEKEMRFTITAIVRPTKVTEENLSYLSGWL